VHKRKEAIMTSQTTFYLSQVLGKKFVSLHGDDLGRIRDFYVDLTVWSGKETEPLRPKVLAVKVRTNQRECVYDFSSFEIKRQKRNIRIICHEVNEVSAISHHNRLWLGENILDKQIVDINGRKLVRVNDIRMVMIPSGTFALAVDVGIEGKLRRIGIDQPLESLLGRFNISIPGKLILWDDIETMDSKNAHIKLSTPSSKLNTLHPSDLADIIEELDKATRASVFAMLDDEKAADVMEELEPHAQIHLVESLPLEKVADVLEKMPADEVADLLDVIEEDRAEKLLAEMEKESSEEVRELLEYSDKVVGSIMSTDFLTFQEDLTVEQAISEIRRQRPEPSSIYSIFIVDRSERFISAISLMELIIADPDATLKQIMNKNPVSVFDHDDVDTLAELVSKYNLLAVPVINEDMKMEGIVVVEDIVDDLMSKRKTR
jgi:CBS domain-containing protein